MSLPDPVPGLVISYSYLWASERTGGAEEGRKNRPCAIVAARQVVNGREVATVVPVTHTPPSDPLDAVEAASRPRRSAVMDRGHRLNDFLWPGPDLRPIPGSLPRRFDYGMLPPRFFSHLREQILQAFRRRSLARVARSE